MLIETKGLSVHQGGRAVLQNVDMSIDAGQIVTIVGPNGSGKTTLLRALIGAIQPSAGKVLRAPGLRVGYVPQKLNLGVAMPLRVRKFLNLPRPVSDDAAARALAHTGADGLEDRQISALSGGQLQRVLLARALLNDPQVLMLDEPTTGLDQPGSARFYQLLEHLAQELNCAILMISHELHVVMSASDRVICLNGHVCCQGTPEHVSAAPAYRELFGSGTGGALALYRHDHDHDHGEEGCDHAG